MSRIVLLLMLAILTALSGIAVDAKKHHHRKHHAVHRETRANGIPWEGEATVYIRNHSLTSRWDASIIQAVDDLNRLTAHMPRAPHWVYVNDTAMGCAEMHAHDRSGINICTTRPGDSWYDYLAPPGCPLCAATRYPVETRLPGMEDGFLSTISVDDTDYVDPDHANECGLDHNQACGIVYTGFRPSLIRHELVHGALDQGHHDHSAAPSPGGIGSSPWGSSDFARAEELFGESSVPFCELIPESTDCE